MLDLIVLPPTEYAGQVLCPRCGDDGTGHRYAICADPGYTHEEACNIGRQYGDLCAPCEADMDLGYQEVREQERSSAVKGANE